MQRTFNYTGRRKIAQAEALFSLTGPSECPSFNVLFKIEPNEFPEDAALYVEAYYKETRQRFSFGVISRIAPPEDTQLNDIDLSGPTLFRVIIVDEKNSHGLLLASGEAFRADVGESDQDKTSILKVVQRPLGKETWKIEIETGGNPALILNNSIPDAIEKMKSDPYFQALVLPAALRQVLMYFLWNEEDQEKEVCEKWMSFAKHFGGEIPYGTDPSTLMGWVDDVVEDFSANFDLCDRLVTVLKGAE